MTVNQTGAVLTKASSGKAHAGNYLTFRLGEEEYGIEILTVQEIFLMRKITKVPRAPSFIRGIINLRGCMIPFVSLRDTFGLEHFHDTDKTCIIVIRPEVADTYVSTGSSIDEVHEVRDIIGEQIEPPPVIGLHKAEEFIKGIGNVENKVIMHLAVNRIYSIDKLHDLTGISHNS